MSCYYHQDYDQPRSYIVQTPNGTTLRRNRTNLRVMHVAPRKLDFSNDTTTISNPFQPQILQHQTPLNTPTSPQQSRVPSPCAQQTPESPHAIPTNDTTQQITRSGRTVVRPSRYGYK